MKRLLFVLLILPFMGSAQLINNAFNLDNDYGDFRMRRYTSGDLVWKRALVSASSSLLHINHSGDFADGIRIMGSKVHIDGNLGLGISNPQSPLHLVSSADAIQTFQTNDDSWLYTNWKSSNGTRRAYMGLSSNLSEFRINVENGTTKIILNGGKVGIGTSNPQQKLALSGGAFSIGDGGNGIPFKIWAGSSGSTNHMRIGTDYGHYGDATLELYQNYSGGSEQNPGKVIVNGSLGIGTNSPDAKLAVKGDIHAEEVKVDLNVPGPDYVFKEDYDLKSLEEVKSHINKHGHLPNIPSAKDMEANGIKVGEMNMKLLEKIEELTLYTLSQQEEIKRLRMELDKNQEVHAEIKQLKKMLQAISEQQKSITDE